MLKYVKLISTTEALMYSRFTFKVIQRTGVCKFCKLGNLAPPGFFPKQGSFQNALPEDKGFQADYSVNTNVCFSQC